MEVKYTILRSRSKGRRKMVGDVTRSKEEEAKRKMSLPFALSLVAGILIIISSTMTLWMMPMFGNWGFMEGMMMNRGSTMGDDNNNVGFNNFMPIMMNIMMSVGIVSGVLVLIGAVMMYYKMAEQAKSWGIVVLSFSIVGLFGGGGFLIGTILGIIGGVMAISRAR